MAAPLATAFVSIRPDLRKFKQETDAGINKGLSGSAEKAGKGWGGRFMKSAGAAVAALGILSLGKTVLSAAQESITTQRQVQAAIKSTGNVAHVSAKQISALASAIEVKTGIDDDAIKSGQAMLLTFTNVRNEAGKGNKIFDQATQTLTDMTAAMNGGNVTSEGLRKQAIQLGKALNDPVKGMTALSRVGVTFTDGQKKQVEAMVKSGHSLDAQKLILHELNKEFGGSAEASATTTKKLSAMVGELEESVGTAILPFVNAMASKLLPVVVQLGNWISSNLAPALGKLANNIFPVLSGVVKAVYVGIATLVTFFKGLPGPVQTAIKILAALVVGGIALRAVLIALEGTNPFGWVAIAVTAVIAGVGLIRQHWQAILDFFKGVGHWFNDFVLHPIEAVFDWIKSHWPLLLAIFTGPFGLIVLWVTRHFGEIRTFIGDVMKSVAVFFLRAVDAMLGGLRGLTGFMGHLPGILGAPFRAGSDEIDKMRGHIHSLIDDFTKVPTNRKITLKVLGQGIWSVVQDITKQLSTGGHISGPGGPTDDRAGLFALSDNEWVIRAASASRYGDKAMDAVNQGTATIFHPGMAEGGRVAGNIAGSAEALGNFTVRKYGETAHAIEDSVVKATRKGLASGWGNGAGGKLINFLRQFVGQVPYVWGGTTPAGWDCSGMVQYGLAHALGISAPRTSEQQFSWVRPSGDQKGALVFFVGAGGPPPGHVGVSLGNGQMINAAGTQWGTIVSGTGGNMGYGVPPGFAKGGKVKKEDPQRKAWLAQLERDVKVLHSDEKAAVHRRKVLRQSMEVSELWFLTHPNVHKGSISYNEQLKSLRGARMRLSHFNKREAEKEGTLRKKIGILRDLTGFPKAKKYGGPGTPSPVDDGGDGGSVDDGGGDSGGSSGSGSGGQTISFPVTTPAMPWQGPYTDAIGDSSAGAPVASPSFPSMAISSPVGGLGINRLNRAYGGVQTQPGGGRAEMFLARIAQLLEAAPQQTGQVMTGVFNGQAGISARQSYYSTR